MVLKFKKVKPDSILPSGNDRDIHSIIPCRILPDSYAAIPTGLSVDIPEGYVLQICSKRSIAERWQVAVLNAPAIIHPGSKDEIIVILKNFSVIPYSIEEGAPIAQAVLVRVEHFEAVFDHIEEGCMSASRRCL